jgi:hypothetical protein
VTHRNPLTDGPTVFVTAVGAAEGSRGAAAALACEGADLDRPALLVDVGGRAPRPTLLATAAAQALEERLADHLPSIRIAARGQVCHLAVPVGQEGMEAAAAAVTVARGAVAVLHLPPASLRAATEEGQGPQPTAVLLRAELRRERALVALAARALIERGLSVGVLKSRLGWVSERRALFGALPPGSGVLPARLLRRLLGDDSRAEA